MLLCYAGIRRAMLYSCDTVWAWAACARSIAGGCGLELVFNERGVYAIIAYSFKSSVADMICLVRLWRTYVLVHMTHDEDIRDPFESRVKQFFIGVRLNFFFGAVCTYADHKHRFAAIARHNRKIFCNWHTWEVDMLRSQSSATAWQHTAKNSKWIESGWFWIMVRSRVNVRRTCCDVYAIAFILPHKLQ